MAGLIFDVNLPRTALTNGTPKTVIQVRAPANQRVRLLGYGLYTDGISATNLPVQVRILTQTSAGAGLLSAAPAPREPELTEAVQSTCQVGSATTQTEPGASTVRQTKTVSGYAGQYEILIPEGQEVYLPGGTYLGFEASNPSGNPAMNVSGYATFEE